MDDKQKIKELEDSIELLEITLRKKDEVIKKREAEIKNLEDQLWECKKENLRY